MTLISKLDGFVSSIKHKTISEERRQVLQPLVDYIQEKVNSKEEILLNFICTHNSRRSHLAQIWAKSMAHFYNVTKVKCYSGGTEATAVFPMIIKTLENTGFQIIKLSEEDNPSYSIKYAENTTPIIAFSKSIEHQQNPKSNFAGIMTCSQAEETCPFVIGAEKRISINYKDPKEFDNTPLQEEKYQERSLQIATELHYVFSKIKSSS